MKNKIIATFGAVSCVLGNVAYDMDVLGLSAPSILIVVALITMLLFDTMAPVRLWKRGAKDVAITFIFWRVSSLALLAICVIFSIKEGSVIFSLLKLFKWFDCLINFVIIVLFYTTPDEGFFDTNLRTF